MDDVNTMPAITQADIDYLAHYTRKTWPKLLPEDVEDIIQNALERFCRDKNYDPSKGKLRSYLWLVAQTEAKNHFQRLYAAKRDAALVDSLTTTYSEDAYTGDVLEAGDSQRDIPDVDLKAYEAGLEPDTVTGHLQCQEATTALETAIAQLAPELQAAIEAALSGSKTWPCHSPRCPSKLALARLQLHEAGVELPIPAIRQDKPASYAERCKQLQADIDVMPVSSAEHYEYQQVRAKQGMKAQGYTGWADDSHRFAN